MLGSPHLVSGVGVHHDSPLQDVHWAITNFVHEPRKALATVRDEIVVDDRKSTTAVAAR